MIWKAPKGICRLVVSGANLVIRELELSAPLLDLWGGQRERRVTRHSTNHQGPMILINYGHINGTSIKIPKPWVLENFQVGEHTKVLLGRWCTRGGHEALDMIQIPLTLPYTFLPFDCS